MSVFVLLTDNDDGCMLVACPDSQSAEALGSAAIWSDGDVSAWRIPTRAVTLDGEHDAILDQLREGSGLHELGEFVGVLDAKVKIEVLP